MIHKNQLAIQWESTVSTVFNLKGMNKIPVKTD